MAISTVARAPRTPRARGAERALAPLSASQRLDLIAAGALGLAGFVAVLVVSLAVTLP